MASAEHGDTPPPELELAWLCGPYHLPEGGGVLDQDYGELMRMRAAERAYSVVNKYRSLSGDDINERLSQSERILLDKLRRIGAWQPGLGSK